MKGVGLDRRQRQIETTSPAIERVVSSQPAAPAPDCSVLITTRNQASFVMEAVASVLAQQTASTFEVIVVDDSSTDETQARLTELVGLVNKPLTYARLKSQVGPGGGRNAAISLARGEILAFTDSDCVADRHWLEGLIEQFADPRVGVVQGRVEGMQRRMALFEHHVEVQQLDGRFPTANTAYRRAALGDLRFNPACWYWEDIDLAWRVLDCGWKPAFAADALILHRIIPLPAMGWILWPRHAAVLPAICAAHPGFRRHLFARVWVEPMNLWFELAVVGVLLTPWRHYLIALAIPYLVAFASARGVAGKFPPAKVAVYVARDVVNLVSLFSASVRRRAVVL